MQIVDFAHPVFNSTIASIDTDFLNLSLESIDKLIAVKMT